MVGIAHHGPAHHGPAHHGPAHHGPAGPGSDGSGSVVVIGYDGVAADEVGVMVGILVEAGLPVVVASAGAAAITSYRGRVRPTRSLVDLGRCRVLVVPGGMGVRRAAADPVLRSAVGVLAAQADWLAASSTGSVLLAASGAVSGVRAATHWLARDLMIEHGLRPVDESWVEHGRLLTAAGAASAVEVAFRLVGALAGVDREEEVRRAHRPSPPSDARYPARVHSVRWPPGRWWRHRRRIETTVLELDQLDASGRVDVVVLDPDGPVDGI